MRNLNHKSLLYAAGLFISALIIGLWSWNTLSHLYGLPQGQFKHVLAAFFLVWVTRAMFANRLLSRPRFGYRHGHQNH